MQVKNPQAGIRNQAGISSPERTIGVPRYAINAGWGVNVKTIASSRSAHAVIAQIWMILNVS